MFFDKQNERKEILQAPFLSGILDAQDIGIIVVDKNCNILLMNTVARNFLDNENFYKNCRGGFDRIFPSLCKHCHAGKKQHEGIDQPTSYEMLDINGCYYSVRYGVIEWIDKTPATVIFLRNVHDERTALEKLNSFAYIDQLTGVPNRRKLMDDFESIAGKIANSSVSGLLAIFDLDDFKTINDSYGHSTGDIMLKRLAWHFESKDTFRGHLYRLGGDEFILFFVDPVGKFSSLTESRQYYDKVLKETLLSYSLPNIEVSCTLSMGVVFFPWQGENFSELLRKADIALYKAKGNNRNQICYFDENDDTAKKFKDLFICIRPVLTRNGTTYGYELVDQSQEAERVGSSLNLHEFNRTIDTLSLDEMESKELYFISFSNQLLNRPIAENLPKNKFVIKIQLSGQPEESDLRKYAELNSLGYLIAFSGINKSNASPEIFRLAHYCQFDPGETDIAFRRRIIETNPSIQFIAIGMDSDYDYETAKNQGYALFQGYFFKRPSRVKMTKEIDPLKVNYLRLLQLTSTVDNVDFQEISSIISSDVALSYKLLRLLNSTAVGLRNPVSSISFAVAYLGEVNLKKWIAMLALRGLSEDKPLELIRLSLIRARFGELLYRAIPSQQNQTNVFLVGLLSLLDVVLEKSKSDVFREIIVSDDIRDSLLTDNGAFSDLVRLFSDYEHANWEAVSEFADGSRLTDSQITNAYIESVKWYNDLIELK